MDILYFSSSLSLLINSLSCYLLHEWPKGSLEEIVQNAIKSWEMEVTHKTRLKDFVDAHFLPKLWQTKSSPQEPSAVSPKEGR
jgi:hypothetical protein